MKDLRKSTQMTQKAFSEYLNIPVRTLQDWEAGRRTPPEYVLELIKYKIEKESRKMKKIKLDILRSKEDGTLTLPYSQMKLSDYDYITIDEFVDLVEDTDSWDEIVIHRTS